MKITISDKYGILIVQDKQDKNKIKYVLHVKLSDNNLKN